MSEELKWKKRFERERACRKEAEHILEEKSAQLYKLNKNLEDRIQNEVKKNAQKERILFQQSKMASMGEMISNIAHQWRQPLHAIAIITERLEIIQSIKGQVTEKDIKEVVRNVNEQLNYLTNTIDDFRNFFIPNKEKKEFCIEEALQKVLSLLAATIENEQITIVSKLEDITIHNLENEIVQVLLNIIKNAIDILIEKNKKNKIIIINISKVDNFVQISICDSAGGIKDNIKDKIFEPYFTTKHKDQGTGLGLYMAHEIITKHINGVLSVENKEFTYKNNTFIGANFKISLPLKKKF